MSDISDLLRAIDASIRSIDYTLGIAANVDPPGSHRVGMVVSQLETAREVLVKARGFGAAKSSGMIPAVQDPNKKP